MRSTLTLAVLLLLGCGSVSSGGSYAIHAYPIVPKAINEPQEVWVKCSQLGAPPEAVVYSMYCVDELRIIELREFINELDSIVFKYQNAIEEINKSN